MNYNKNNRLMQWALRAGVCLFMLSGTCATYAQGYDDEEDEVLEEEVVPRKQKKIKVPVYEMKTVSGRVLDAATGKPMGGVRVQALNNDLYTAMTDEDGEYTISVPKFVTVLYYSVPEYNGLQVPVKGPKMADAKMLTTHFKSFYANGTSVLSTRSAKIVDASSISVDADIENTMGADVRTITRGGIPGQGNIMLVNGITSLNSSSQPLVVVDGMVWDMMYDRGATHTGFQNNVLSVIDVDDIENVEIMKNGVALYGAKGANGVIRITTKRGKSMATRINARVFGGFETKPSVTDVMNANQYRSYLTELLGTTDKADGNASNMHINFLNEDPSYTFYNLYHNNTDWSKGLYETAYTTNYKINVQGGDASAMYNLSLGYTESDATDKGSDFKRLTSRFNTDVKITDKLNVGLDMSYSRVSYGLLDNGWAESYAEDNISSPGVLGLLQAPFLSPYSHVIVWDYKNQCNVLREDRKVYSGKFEDDVHNPFKFASAFDTDALANPYWVLKNGHGKNRNYQEQTEFAMSIAPKYQINHQLSISDNFNYFLDRTNEKYYFPVYGSPKKFVDGKGDVNSSIKSQFDKETAVYNDFRIDWKKQMAEHYLNVFGGFRFSSYTFSNSYAAGYNNKNDKSPNMTFDLDYINYGGCNDTWVNLSYYANADYNYKNRYFANVTLNAESSSRFGKEGDAGLKLFGVTWGIFPSIQAGWLISSENWFKSKAINYLKLTAGYEESGNDNIDYYASRTYFANVKFMDQATGLQLANIENPKLQWETTRRFNVGLQTSMFNNRLALAAEFFYAKTSDLLTKKRLSYVTGLPTTWTNDGALENTGVNVSADVILLNTKNWKWQAGFSMAHYKNEVTELPSSDHFTLYSLNEDGTQGEAYKKIKGYTSSVYGKDNILTTVGQAAGVFYGYKTRGVFSSDEKASHAGKYGYLRYPTGKIGEPSRDFRGGDVHFVDVNGDGWISDADIVKIGDPNPDIYGNIYTSLSWKRFTLDVSLKYSVGNDVFNYQRSMLEQGNTPNNQTKAMVNRWRYNGQVTDVARAVDPSSESWVNNERFSDRWIEDGSYLKLKKIRLTYRLPLSLSWLQGVTIFGEANNVFTITKYLGDDPEVSAGNGILYQGIDAGRLPSNFNCNFGLTLNL